ncbi:malonyl-CoA O-methyltransferase [Geothermobacter ehrlichii]|uniref:Malonyl-[acyl-carrier protein] O-methyltransferase n=1 Tax=Geothermobacter ehrlichii TaxID=213224 RepID=A0A5D3WKN1_9BACT|nr:methyltransferase domain-containing protein [Geothermobacter ehrlichii]TYO98761.1 malonyl-CoA O-methyltransferase [Geothermobacter ehrlichii]
MSSPVLNRQLVRRHFSSHAADYDRYARVQKRVVARLGELFAWPATCGRPVLDVGTGTGYLARRILERRPETPLVLSDLAHGMTCCARHNLGGLSAVDADAVALPFADAVFAGVVSSSVYQWVVPLEAAFAEVERVLEVNGWFVFALFGEGSLCELRQAHEQASRACGRHRSHFQTFPSAGRVEQALARAGLRLEQLQSEREVEYHPDVPSLLRSLKRIGAGNASASRPPGLASRRVMSAMIALYERRWRCEKGIPASYEVIYGIARKQG